MSIKEKVKQPLLNLLKASGAKYYVVLGDERLTNIEGEFTFLNKSEKSFNRGGGRGPVKLLFPKGFIAAAAAMMTDGAVHEIKAPKGVTLNQLQSGLTAHLSARYGAGSYCTTINRKKGVLEVLVHGATGDLFNGGDHEQAGSDQEGPA